MNNKFIIALVAGALSALLLVGCMREPSTPDLAGLYTSRGYANFVDPLVLLKPDSSYVSVYTKGLDCGIWTLIDGEAELEHKYSMSEGGYISLFYHKYVPYWSNITTALPDTAYEEKVFFVGLLFDEPVKSWYETLLYTDGRSSKNYKYDYKTEHFYKNVRQHKKVMAGLLEKFMPRPERAVLFSCRLDDHIRLDRVPVTGVSSSHFTLADLGGSYCFRFKEWRRDTDPRSPSSAPMWYESHLPLGISEFLALDRGNMFVLYRDGTAVWLHCGPEAEGHAPGPADTASYLVARNFPVAGDAEASALLDVIRDRLLSGGSVVAGSERGFALAGSIPPDKAALFGRMLCSTFKTSPSVMLKYNNSLMYTPSEYIIDRVQGRVPEYAHILRNCNGEIDGLNKHTYIDYWASYGNRYWYNKDWKLNGCPLVIPARPHATGIYRKDYTGLRELVAADGLVLPVRGKSADMSDVSSVLFHVRPDTLWCRVPQLADRFCNTALRRSASVPDLGYDYEQYVIDSFETRGSGNGFMEVNRHASRYMVKMGLDPDRVIYEVYSSVGVPVACDFWKLGKHDIGSYGLRRDGDSLVITIRLREK